MVWYGSGMEQKDGSACDWLAGSSVDNRREELVGSFECGRVAVLFKQIAENLIKHNYNKTVGR